MIIETIPQDISHRVFALRRTLAAGDMLVSNRTFPNHPNVTYIEHELNIAFEKCLLGAHADSSTEYLASGRQIQTAHFEPSVHHPQLGERENFMWHQGYRRLVYLPSPRVVLTSIVSE